MPTKNDTRHAFSQSLSATFPRDHDQERSPGADNSEMQLVEARTAIILLKNARLTSKNEYTQWMLKSLFQPVRKKECESMHVLYLSRNRKSIWHPDHGSQQEHVGGVPSTRDHVHVLTPRTNILTVTQEYRLVYIIDLSSSLATVGCTHALILLAEVFQTLRKSLEGIVQPFVIPVSPDEKALIKPLLRLSVMADCSQFASNINVIPMLVDHPTIRVFAQNVLINPENIDLIIKQLYDEFQSFQSDMTSFRKFMKKKRSNMDYNLDVRSDVIPENGNVLDATSLATLPTADSSTKTTHPESHKSTSTTGDTARKTKGTGSLKITVPPLDRVHEEATRNASKEVWGMGKSGANLSRILHAGQFALNLLPHQGQPQLILITDGAVKSNVHDNTFVRQFAEDDITCHIIQISYSHSFVPGRNFGFVPDTEILRFLARATGGSFIYSEHCQSVNTKAEASVLQGSFEPTQSLSFKTTPSASPEGINDGEEYPSVKIIPNKDTNASLPNIYHQWFLFRESLLSKQPKEAREKPTSRHMRDGRGREVSSKDRSKYNFPWDPEASAPEEELCLLKYREYLLPPEISHTIAARAREGFILQTLTFDDGAGGKSTALGLQNIGVSDFGAVKKERIQIVMVLHWQPNVAIEYRLRATWLPTVIGHVNQVNSEALLKSTNIFSRVKAPRAEIFVRTDAQFAHMLQNWDVIRRRAQMVRAVTGGSYLGEAKSSPAYAKIEKLKAYLVDIFEGDEGLKAMVGFSNTFIMSRSDPVESLRQDLFVSAFRTFWKQTNAGDARSRTRCWYDYGCIDVLVGDVSPYMSPKLASSYNQDFETNVETIIQTMIENFRSVLKTWADFEDEDGTCVKIFHRVPIEESKDHPTVNRGYPPSFAEVRLRREYGRLITIRVLFFNVDVTARQRAMDHLTLLLKTSDLTKAGCNYICKRPFSSLLMRDRKHFQAMTMALLEGSKKRQDLPITPSFLHDVAGPHRMAETWYLPPSMWLTSEYIVRDYLKHMTWSWQTDNHQDQYHKENKMMPIYDLAFQFLCQARIDQGYHLVSPRPDNTQFYQEIPLPARGRQKPLSAIQYYIWKDADSGKITTELWMEPNADLSIDQYELVKTWTVEPDRKTISQLVTFDQIHAVGRSKGKGDFKAKAGAVNESGGSEEDTMVMKLPQLFDVASVLRTSKFVVATFTCPHFERYQVERDSHAFKPYRHHVHESQSLQDLPSMAANSDLAYIRRPPLLDHRVKSTSSSPTIVRYDLVRDVCMRPDPILNRCKHVIATLETREQSYALLHYLFERSLSTITDGEIIMTNHDNSSGFWTMLDNAMSACQSDTVSCTSLISDLKKTRCFVKVLDVRSFVVILFPMTEAVAESLSAQNSQRTSESIPHYNNVDTFIFECHRQKPMRPTRNSLLFSSPLEASNRVRIANIALDEKVVITKMGRVGRGLEKLEGIPQPELYEGQFENASSQTELTDATSRIVKQVSTSFSKSFFMSFYTYLIRGFSVDDDDLNKVLAMCDASAIEIDIHEFVSIMTYQRNKVLDCEEHEQEIQEKFMTLFRYYFEPVVTKSSMKNNLFYYKPPFCRMPASVAQQQEQAMSEDEKVAVLVDLVGCAQTPLLVRLECTYTSPAGDSETIMVPIDSLPMSYTGYKANGTSHNFEPSTMQNFERFPLDFGDTSISLRLVCLTLPKMNDSRFTYAPLPVSAPAKPSFIDLMPSKPDCFSALQPEQQNALAETEARIRWLLTEEVIHGMLRAHSINEPVINYVESKLSGGSPFVDFPTLITLPLHFVKDLAESRLTFMNELERHDMQVSNKKYGLRRVGDYFYVNEDRFCNMRGEQSFSNSASPTVVSRPPSISESDTDTAVTDEGHLDLHDGLGISVLDNASGHDTSSDDIVPFPERPLYWLILLPKERNVQIYFYSKLRGLLDRSTILDRIKAEIMGIQRRTNRIMLLSSLQSTHMCSKFLEELPSRKDESTANSEEESDIATSETEGAFIFQGKFSAGQFKCPIVCTKRFPLHWRLLPNAAVNYLSTDVLRLFKVTNRPNMYVIERDDDIVYCKVFEENMSNNMGVTDTPTTIAAPTDTSTYGHKDDTDTDPAMSSHEVDREEAHSPTEPKATIKTCRELVVQVHGIDLPTWVEREFFDLIENRLISNITLNEVQQVFVRNPKTKPTIADVDFVFATGKPPSYREILRIPALVESPYSLMVYLKQLLLTDNIKPFCGPNVATTMKNYWQRTFYDNEDNHLAIQSCPSDRDMGDGKLAHDIEYDSFCFYYNCTKRVPGSSSSLELNVGQGLAGISMVLLDRQGKPIFRVQDDKEVGTSFDPEMIRCCLEDQCRETAAGAPYYHLWIDIWAVGATNHNALAQHLYDCYRQSLCDYLIEKTVSIDLAEALSVDGALQRAIFSSLDRRIGTVLRKNVIESVLYILRKAAEWKSRTVCSFEQDIQIAPWCMDGLVDHLDSELQNMNGALKPTVAWTSLGNDILTDTEQLNSDNKWQLYNGHLHRLHQHQKNIQLVAISGLREFVEQLESARDSRRPSMTSDRSNRQDRSRQGSETSIGQSLQAMADPKTPNKGDDRTTIEEPRSPSTRSTSGISSKTHRSPKADPNKHCFLIMTMNRRKMAIYTYNWLECTSTDVFKSIATAVDRQKARNDILGNILHQKMGLFHHAGSIKRTVENHTSYLNMPTLSTMGHLHCSSTPQLPLVSTPKPVKKSDPSETPPKSSVKTSAHSSRRNTSSSLVTTSRICDIKEMIVYPAAVPGRPVGSNINEATTGQPIEEDEAVHRWKPEAVRTAELDHALMDSITESVADTNAGKDTDVLRRHGQSFLEMYMRRATLQTAHEKAMKAYTKWRRRYGVPDAADTTENLTRPEVSTILRSSRVFHFCRTPLLLCNLDTVWPDVEEGSPNREKTIAWYKKLANTLTAEYSTYLEKVDMQLIDFEKADFSDEDFTKTSRFDVGKNLSVENASTYLLRVFDGGSLICEVRLTSVFVSVTLYTLHRQYGRLDYSRFVRETRAKKRLNFQKFEKNCGYFRQVIHINSFVYDFHLRYIQRILESEEPLPADLDILNLIRRFALLNLTPATYSRNRILHGFYEFDSDLDAGAFFGNLFRNAHRQELCTIYANQTPTSVSISSSRSDFVPDTKSEDKQWRHTLVVCPVDAADKAGSLERVDRSHIMFEYFILVVYQHAATPDSMAKNNWMKTKKKRPALKRADSLDELVPKETYTLGDLVVSARKKIDDIVSQLTVSCKRVEHWSSIYNETIDLASRDPTTLLDMINEFDHVDITEADGNMKRFFDLRINWVAALDAIARMERNHIKDIQSQGQRHMLIYGPHFLDYLIHLRVDTNHTVSGWLVSREERKSRAQFDSAEKEHILRLGRLFCYFMWEKSSHRLDRH